jgi:hypothetical protein
MEAGASVPPAYSSPIAVAAGFARCDSPTFAGRTSLEVIMARPKAEPDFEALSSLVRAWEQTWPSSVRGT